MLADRVAELFAALDLPVCLKLHPMASDEDRWESLANQRGCRIDKNYWSLDNWKSIRLALCIGHPGSSIIDLASLRNKLAVVIPWSRDDMDLLTSYNIAFYDAPSARKVDASPSRPLFPLGGLMEQSNASLQRGRQG